MIKIKKRVKNDNFDLSFILLPFRKKIEKEAIENN